MNTQANNANAIVDSRNIYGTQETAGLVNGQDYHDQFADAPRVFWTEKGLRITRLRLLSDPGFPAWDVSYCHGMLGGKPVRVELPFSQLPKFKMREAIVRYAKAENVFAKGLGIFEAISQLK